MLLDRRVVPFDVKAVSDDANDASFEGYGSVFGVVDAYDDIVAPGAFRRSLAEWRTKKAAPAMLWQHDPHQPTGVWDDLREDAHGLFVRGRLAPTQLGRDAHALLKMGALSGLSIGFRTRKSETDNDSGLRTLTDIELWEVSIVTFPANDPARITGVKADGTWPTEREFEGLLRDAGFSRTDAKSIIAKGYRRQAPRDAAQEADPEAELLSSLNQLLTNLRS
jgi:uncharacterized protein